jgi:hypothetical protein
MEKTSSLVNTIFSTTKEYINIKTKSVKLDAYEKMADTASAATNGAVIAVIGLFAFLFLNIGAGFWLSEVLESTKLGFLTLGGFYVVVLGIYFAVKNAVATKIKNSVVVSMSKNTFNDYAQLVKEKETIGLELTLAEAAVKQNIEELKDNLDTLVEDVKRIKRDFNKLKSNFVSDGPDHNHNGHSENGANQRIGPKMPRIAITSVLDLILNKLVFKNAGMIAKTLVPVVANALVTSTVFKESGKTSLLENLKLKFAKFL